MFGIWAESPTIPKPLIKFTKSPFGVTLAEVVTILASWDVLECVFFRDSGATCWNLLCLLGILKQTRKQEIGDDWMFCLVIF